MLALNILISIAILLQIVALTISLRLMRITKFNAAWILFSVAFLLMLIQLLSELIGNFRGRGWIDPSVITWIWLLTTMCFTSGLFVINKLIKYIDIMYTQKEISQRRTLNTVITTEEKERRRFSNDLHDGLGPLLSAAKLSISALNSSQDASSQKEILKSAEEVINEAIKSLKEISNNLNPHVLNNFGISSALNSFVNKLTLPETMKLSFTSELDSTRYPQDIEAVIYRVVCELINNSIKHSNATVIDVRCKKAGDYIEIIVSDNGVGFDYVNYDKCGVQTGLGLSSVTTRISSIKGSIKIDSKPKQGTVITIKVNVK
ncbi:MAG: ATP-binding protein [Rikenellaceae bacterium]